MMPGMNPRKMNQMMRKMGISQVDIDATEVIIRTPDKEIVILSPQVAKVNMMGQETYQIVGQAEERSLDTSPEINDEDIETVMAQAEVSKEEAIKAIEDAEGDLAAAIMSLKED